MFVFDVPRCIRFGLYSFRSHPCNKPKKNPACFGLFHSPRELISLGTKLFIVHQTVSRQSNKNGSSGGSGGKGAMPLGPVKLVIKKMAAKGGCIDFIFLVLPYLATGSTTGISEKSGGKRQKPKIIR